MFQVKKAYELPSTIPLPDCMYKVKPIQTGSEGFISSNGEVEPTPNLPCHEETVLETRSSNTLDTPKSGKKNKKTKQTPSPAAKKFKMDETLTGEGLNMPLPPISPEVFESIQNRQLAIIEKLQTLRDTITDIHSRCSAHKTRSELTDPSAVISSNYIDFVIKADPRKPPLSLLFLRKFLDELQTKNVVVKTFIHSSCREMNGNFFDLFKFRENENMSSENCLTINLIWKQNDAEESELIVNPLNKTIKGEADMARFISRLYSSVFPLNYGVLDWDTLAKVDEILEEASKEIKLDKVAERLKSSSPFLQGKDATIGDFVYFSAVANDLLRNNSKSIKTFKKVEEWIHTCQKLGGFSVFK